MLNFCFCSTWRPLICFQISLLILSTNFSFIFESLLFSFQLPVHFCSMLFSPMTSVYSIFQHLETHSLIHPYPTPLFIQPLFIQLFSALPLSYQMLSYLWSALIYSPCLHWEWVFFMRLHQGTSPNCYYYQRQQTQSILGGTAPLGLTYRNQIMKMIMIKIYTRP